MTAKAPYVSICLPVYNGERYLREVIGSIRAQTFENFELIISDNASTDGTKEICLEISIQDHRVSYFCSDVNRGLSWNWNRAAGLARGRYLVWICHDDRIEPNFISRCVEMLDLNPDAVLCFTNANYIDYRGNLLSAVDLTNPGGSDIPSKRFDGILSDSRCDPVCGLMRVASLERTHLHGAYADSDRVLLAEMALRGRFIHIPEWLFSRRLHASQTTTKYRDRWDRSLIFDPSKHGRLIIPWLRELIDLMRAILLGPITWNERYSCTRYLYWWCSVHSKFLKQDISRGLRLLFCPTLLHRKVGVSLNSGVSSNSPENDTQSSLPKVVRAMGFMEVPGEDWEYQPAEIEAKNLSNPSEDITKTK